MRVKCKHEWSVCFIFRANNFFKRSRGSRKKIKFSESKERNKLVNKVDRVDENINNRVDFMRS